MSLPHGRAVTRAMWVTRFDYKTPTDIEKIAQSCEEAGCNTIIFQVRGNATAFYKSSYEPWAEQFNFTDPGFDPLEVALAAAHGRNLKLLAWVNVVPAWWGSTKPTDSAQIYNKKPEWAWYDKSGGRQPLADKFYVSLNPCLPEVREYISNVIEDLVARYPIDGLHLDYMRFPNDPVGGTAKAADYPRDNQTVALFKADTNKSPDSDPAAWDQWRTEQVTKLVSDIRRTVNQYKPYLEISVAVGPVPEVAKSTHFQDVKTWMKEHLVDVVYPMNYTRDPKVFDERVAQWKEFAGRTPVVMGVRIDDDIETDRAQLASVLHAFRGYSIFAYSSLFDSPNQALDKQDETTRERRALVRKALLPQLAGLSQSGAAASAND
ncbi:MAG: family 10 glycosylhydrolase [Planctomycetes bacterium]|nr:family 10 glycosylhydrolase [Planctomycetota bacterium]